MEISIVFEDLNLFSEKNGVKNKNSVSKKVRLKIRKPQIILFASILLSIILIILNAKLVGILFFIFSFVIYFLSNIISGNINLDFEFGKEDKLTNIIESDLFERN